MRLILEMMQNRFQKRHNNVNQAYLEYKQKQIESAKTRVFVTWRNSKGKDCKTIGID